jgi:hypothetical protein
VVFGIEVSIMDELKNQASKIKQAQEKYLEEITKTSLEQKGTDDIINTHEKEKRKLEEELSGINFAEYLIKFHFFTFSKNKF